MTGNKPLKKISAGPVSAALWENEIKVNGQNKTVLKALIQKRFTGDFSGSGLSYSHVVFACPSPNQFSHHPCQNYLFSARSVTWRISLGFQRRIRGPQVPVPRQTMTDIRPTS